MGYEDKIRQGVGPHLEPGETVRCSFRAAPRGYTGSMTAGAGASVAAAIGRRQQRSAYAAAEQAELRLAAPMAVVLTDRRLLLVKLGTVLAFGIGGAVKELLGSVALEDIESIDVKRVALRQNIELTTRGATIRLETNGTAGARGLSEAFEQARAPLAR